MKKILIFLLFVSGVVAAQNNLPKKVLAEAGARYTVNDSTTSQIDSFLITSRAIRGDLDNVYNSRGRFLNLYKKLLNGSAVSGSTASRGDVHVRQAGFGDSVGGYLAVPIANKGVAMFGNGGGILSSVAVTGGASVHQNTSETTYWFNGTWYVIAGSGSLTFTLGGGRVVSNIIKIYYIKESGAGTFQVQLDAGAGYVNEGSVVDANDATTQAGIITINKTQDDYGVRINQVSGTVRIIMVVAINEVSGSDSWCYLPLNVGGLNWEYANLTSRAITSPVFADLTIDLATIEFKENTATVYNQFKSWLDDFRSVADSTDWVLIGSPPLENNDSINTNVNAALKQIAIEDTLFYYDSRIPLESYDELVRIGWQGDGIHTAAATGFYNAWQLWNIIGIEDVLMFGNYFGTSKNGYIRLNANRGIQFEGSANDGLPNGKIYASTVGPDMNIDARRSISFNTSAGSQFAYIESNSGIVISANTTTRGFVWPSTLIPGVSLSGMYKINDSTYGAFTNKGAGRAANWAARSLGADSLAIGLGVGLSPSPSSIAEIASTTKGLLIPRMSAAQRIAIVSPANWLLVMDTDSARIMQYVSGSWYGYRKTNESSVIPLETTATITGVTNVASATSGSNMLWYERTGNKVKGSLVLNVTPTAGSTLTQVAFSLPVASNLSISADLRGVGNVVGSSYEGLSVSGDATNDRGTIEFMSQNTASHQITITFEYRVL